MKKSFSLIMSVFSLLFIFCSVLSCAAETPIVGINSAQSGIISGKAKFTNVESSSNGGIIVTLDSTNGLLSSAVVNAVESQNVARSARSAVCTTVTSSDGSYLFSDLQPGTYTVYASSSYSKERAVCTNVIVRSNQTTIAEVLSLTATGSISGKITLDGASSGNTGFLVFIAGTSYMAMTDDLGNYKISDVPAGTGYLVVATKNSVIHSISSNVTVKANDTVTMPENYFTSLEILSAGKGEKGDTGEKGTDGKDGSSIVWRGSYASSSEITNPKYLDAYFNTTDGCSYIYTGNEWTLLAMGGVNGGGSTGGTVAIGTVLDTEEPTNQNVIITVNISSKNISKIGYVYSANHLNWSDARGILNSSEFNVITADSDGKYKISAFANGYYTIAVKDSEGFVCYTEEYITNIDKTAPASVTELTAKYNRNTKVISVNWENPSDSDLSYVSLSYTKDGVSVVSDSHQSGTSYLINDVETDGKEYIFTLYAIDKAGNKSTSVTKQITPADSVSVQSISLSRYHLAYNDTDQTITAVAYLNNVDLLTSETVIKIQTKDSSGNVTNTDVTLDSLAATATATITVPSSSSNSSSLGQTYTVLCKIGDEAADTSHTARFNVSATASYCSNYLLSYDGSPYSNKLQIPLSSITPTSKVNVMLQGYNLDLITSAIQLYDSFGASYFAEPIIVDTSSVRWTDSSGSNIQRIEMQISVPVKDDSYTLKVFLGTELQDYYSGVLQVYDEPKFISFTIPQVSISKKDNFVTAYIYGKNFDTPVTDLGNFTVSCSENPSITSNANFTKISDSLIRATFKIPGIVGEYNIKITYGLNSKETTFKVSDFSAYNVGDVLLNDGTIVKYSDSLTFSDEQKQNAVGVLCLNEYGVPVGWLGLHNSSSAGPWNSFSWAEYGTKGYNTLFTDIICTPSSWDSGAASTATFTGDTDGSDNWAYICLQDAEGTKGTTTNYHAFNYVNKYASTFGLTGTYAEGWYMPSLAELAYIYRNKTRLNAVLKALGGDYLTNNAYWSSSQSKSSSICSWILYFSNGRMTGEYKRKSNPYPDTRPEDSIYVCCVLPFSN